MCSTEKETAAPRVRQLLAWVYLFILCEKCVMPRKNWWFSVRECLELLFLTVSVGMGVFMLCFVFQGCVF